MAEPIRRHSESISALAVSLVVGAVSFFAFEAPTVSGDLRFDRALVFYAGVGMVLGAGGAMLSSLRLLRRRRVSTGNPVRDVAVSPGPGTP